MRASILRLAESITQKPLNLRETGATLLPPIPCVLGLSLDICHALTRINTSLGCTVAS